MLNIRHQRDENNVYFFKDHQQPLRKHPEQMQELVKLSSPTARVKTIKTNIIEYVSQYWNGTMFQFMGVVLNSTTQQVSKVRNQLVNKEFGAIKRTETILQSKGLKAAEKDRKLRLKLDADEALFQAMRARRLAELTHDRQAAAAAAEAAARAMDV